MQPGPLKNDAIPSGPTRAAVPARATARFRIAVRSSESLHYGETMSPALVELKLHAVFAGDLVGDSPVRALQVLHEDGSASMVSAQRFRRTLGARRGTFVLQGSETVTNGKITAKWSVVIDSGTDELSGLRGEGGFEGEFGKGSVGKLEYWFER